MDWKPCQFYSLWHCWYKYPAETGPKYIYKRAKYIHLAYRQKIFKEVSEESEEFVGSNPAACSEQYLHQM